MMRVRRTELNFKCIRIPHINQKKYFYSTQNTNNEKKMVFSFQEEDDLDLSGTTIMHVNSIPESYSTQSTIQNSPSNNPVDNINNLLVNKLDENLNDSTPTKKKNTKEKAEKKPRAPPKSKTFDKSEIQLKIEKLTALSAHPTNNEGTTENNPIDTQPQEEAIIGLSENVVDNKDQIEKKVETEKTSRKPRQKKEKEKSIQSSSDTTSSTVSSPEQIEEQISYSVDSVEDTLPTKKRSEKKAKVHVTAEITIKAHENYNQIFTSIFEEIGNYEKILGNYEKFKAYHKVIKTLRALDHKIDSGKEALKLDGIGKKIAVKIDEIIRTGSLQQLVDYQENPMIKAIKLFQRIQGVGPSAAAKWVLEDNLRTLDDLKKIKLTHHQEIGLRYFYDFEERIPREEADHINAYLQEALKEVDPLLIGNTCGSYRRGLPTSGDIDMILTHPEYTISNKNNSDFLERVVNLLTEKKLLTDHISLGKTKYMGVGRLQTPEHSYEKFRRIDFRLIPVENYWCGVLYFTGSDYFNKQMRTIALERGYTLNEYELKPISSSGEKGEPVSARSEEEIFERLGMEYRKPSERNL